VKSPLRFGAEPEPTPELTDEEALALGRILGEALVAEFRRGQAPMVNSPAGRKDDKRNE
jgi:hypothetical protein